jgi:hypothetical protein
MSGNLLDGLNPVTQTIDSGKALAKFLGIKGELPETIVLANGARLVLSTKRDAYYFVSVDGCTCKGFTYRRTCKHVKALESPKPHGHGQSMAETLRQADANLSKMPYQYRRMVQAAREEAEAVDEPIPESQCSKAICKPVSEEERAAKIAAAKANCEANRQQAREHQARRRASTSSSMLIDAYAPTTTPGEIEYWQAKMEA